MKKSLLFFLLALCASASAQAAMTLDGNISASGASATLTTTQTNDIIIVEIQGATVTATVSSVSDSKGLTYSKRTALATGTQNIEVWWALAATAASSDVITPTMSTGVAGRVTAFGIHGANTAAPFDPNSSLPGANTATTASSTTATITTNNQNAFLYTFLRSTGTSFGTITRPSGFSQIVNAGTLQDTGYSVVTSRQLSVSENYSWTGGNANTNYIVDAVQGAITSSSPVHHAHGFPE